MTICDEVIKELTKLQRIKTNNSEKSGSAQAVCSRGDLPKCLAFSFTRRSRKKEKNKNFNHKEKNTFGHPQKTLVFVVLVLIGMMLLVVLFLKPNVPSDSFALVDLKSPVFKSLAVENAQFGYEIYSDGNIMGVVGLPNDVIEAEKCESLISEIMAFRVDFVETADENTKVKYGLKNPVAKVKVKVQEGKNKQHDSVVQLYIGAEGPANLGRYAQILERDVICVIPKSITDLLESSSLEFVSNSLFQGIDANMPKDFELEFSNLKTANEVLIARHVGENSLELANSSLRMLLCDEVKTKLIRLMNLKAESVLAINPTADELDSFGLFEPYVQLAMKSENRREVVKISEDIDGQCCVLCNQERVVLNCFANDLLILNNDAKALSKEKILGKQVAEVESFELFFSEKTLQADKNNGVWQLHREQGEAPNDDCELIVEEFLAKIESFDLGNSSLITFGDDKVAEAKLEIKYNNQERDRYSFFITQEDAFVVWGDRKLYFKVNLEDLKSFCDLARQMFDVIAKQRV